jgi:tRNA(fMet)-specific endonuclease VapC
MQPRILLDTSAYAQFRRGHREAVEILVAAERVFISTVTLGELEAGFLLGSRTDENRSALRDFLAEPFVGVVPIDEGVARRYAGVFVTLRRAGTPIPINDVWIAACALHIGAELVTFDADFRRVADLDARVLVP